MRIPQANGLQTVFDTYPDFGPSIVRQKEADKLALAKDVYQEYLDKVRTIPAVPALLATDKKYIKPQQITPEGLGLLLGETTKLADKLVTP